MLLDWIVFCHTSEVLLGSNGSHLYPESLFEERLINFTHDTAAHHDGGYGERTKL